MSRDNPEIPRFPGSIREIVGKGLSTEDKSKIWETAARWFGAQQELKEQLQRELGLHERQLQPEEQQIVQLVNEATNEILQQNRLSPLDVSADHVHMLPHEAYQQLFPGSSKGEAKYNPVYQAIFLSDLGPDDLVEFAQTLFHEMIHFKFWNSLQVTDGEEDLQTYRTGLTTVSRDGTQVFLRELNEAVTEDLTEDFFAAIVKKDPLFAAELERGIRPRGYVTERKRYNELLLALRNNTQERYSIQDLKALFVRSAATGNLFPVVRLIDDALGKGTFQNLVHEAESVVDSATSVG